MRYTLFVCREKDYIIVDQLPGIGIKGKAGLQAVFSQVADVVEEKFSQQNQCLERKVILAFNG